MKPNFKSSFEDSKLHFLKNVLNCGHWFILSKLLGLHISSQKVLIPSHFGFSAKSSELAQEVEPVTCPNRLVLNIT